MGSVRIVIFLEKAVQLKFAKNSAISQIKKKSNPLNKKIKI
jgi:hypothetical protein